MGQHLAHVKFLLMLVNECVNLRAPNALDPLVSREGSRFEQTPITVFTARWIPDESESSRPLGQQLRKPSGRRKLNTIGCNNTLLYHLVVQKWDKQYILTYILTYLLFT